MKLYIRIDYKIGEKNLTNEDCQEYMNYVGNIAEEQFFMGGIISNSNIVQSKAEGMCLFKAENMEEAQKISNNDPIIAKGYYRCEIFEWDVMVLPEKAKSIWGKI